jgi:hypothetical protein
MIGKSEGISNDTRNVLPLLLAGWRMQIPETEAVGNSS